MVAEIYRGSQIFYAPETQTPINFGAEICFGKLLPIPKLCKNI